MLLWPIWSIPDEIKTKCDREDVSKVFIDHTGWKKVIVVPTYLCHFNTKDIFSHIDAVVNSIEDIPTDGGLDINVAVCKPIQEDDDKQVIFSLDTLFRRSCVITLRSKNTCLPRAIVACMAHLKSIEH